jgi:hypothetical protein
VVLLRFLALLHSAPLAVEQFVVLYMKVKRAWLDDNGERSPYEGSPPRA